MANSTLVVDYLGEGTHANRPATPALPTGGLGFYYETDTLKLFFYDLATTSWIQVGAGGSSSTNIYNSIGGLTLSNDGTTPNSVIDIAAGTAMDSTNATVITIGAFTKSTAGAWASGTGNNGMGNGLTVGNNTWYHVMLANNSGTADIWFDTSVTGANRPAGISDTKYRRIGSFKTDGSAHIYAFTQRGDEFNWNVQKLDVNGASITAATPTNETISVPPGVSVVAHVTVFDNTSAAAHSINIFDPAASHTQASGNVMFRLPGVQGGSAMSATTNTSQQITVLSDGTITNNLFINTLGWRDFRGQT